MPYENYWVEDDTLIVEGKFFGISTGLMGGWRKVRYAFNHTVRDENLLNDPNAYLREVARRYGLKNYFGLLTSVPMDKLSVSCYDEVTVFATAGVQNPNERIGTINIIAVLDCRVSRAALLNAIITVTEAKSKSLIESGCNFTGTSTDAVVILTTCRGKYYRYSGPASELGAKIWKTTIESVSTSLEKWKGFSRSGTK